MNIGAMKRTVAEVVEANADAGHERLLSRAAALRGDLPEVVRRQAAADRAEARLDSLIERLDAEVEAIPPEAPGVVGAAAPGYVTDTAAVAPGRPTEGDPGTDAGDNGWLRAVTGDGATLHRAARSRGRQRVRVELRRGDTVLARGSLWRAEGAR